MFCLAKFF